MEEEEEKNQKLEEAKIELMKVATDLSAAFRRYLLTNFLEEWSNIQVHLIQTFYIWSLDVNLSKLFHVKSKFDSIVYTISTPYLGLYKILL